MRRALRYVRTEPSAVLFFTQLAAVLLYPFLEEGSGVGRAVFSVFGILVLGLVVLAVRDLPALNWIALVFAVPATVLLVIQAVTESKELFPWSSALEAVLYFYAAFALIKYMLADHDITRDELFAVGATFTLFAWAFAYTYVVVQAVEPASFGEERTWMELLFVSFTTLSGTGLSDITPAEPFARGVVMLQQVVGLGYIAIVVSRLVGLTTRASR